MHDPATLSTARADWQTVCYLVHSLSYPDFPRKNAGAAEALGEAVARAVLPRIIDPEGSATAPTPCRAHLRSPCEAGKLPAAAGFP